MVAEGGYRKMSYIQQNDENGSKTNKDAMEIIDRYHLDGLKRKKTQAKAVCRRTRRKLMTIKALQQIDDAQQVALEIMSEIADEYKSCNDLKNVHKVTGEMENIEEITTEVTERAQAYLDSRRDDASRGQKTEVGDLQSARYQGDLEAVTNRFDQLKLTEEGKKKLSSKSNSEKIDKKMKVVDANQKDKPTEMNDQQHKQPWRKPNRWTVEGKDGVSAMSLDKKVVRSINNFDDGEPLRNKKLRRTKRQREKADTHKAKSRE